MRLILICVVSLGILSCSQAQLVQTSMREDLSALAHDSLVGRKTGSPEELKAAAYIAKRFQSINLVPKGEEGFYQAFTFTESISPHQETTFTSKKSDNTRTGTNVIGYLDNGHENTVIIGAHYDHLGMGGSGSLYREGLAIHNGADDNASGVAMMLHLAQQLKSKKAPKQNNYLFIAFSGEEEGLLGSNYFVKNPTIDLSYASYMINMDMVGRLNMEKTLAVYGTGTSPIFERVIDHAPGPLNIVKNESGIGPSDHTSFYLADIPVLHFFTGQHVDYHKPSDEVDKINFEGMNIVSDYIYHIISALDNHGKLEFQKTKNESEVTPDFKVTLGVVPDYLYSGKGMRIDGISEGKPAQKAGLQKGDIVLKMGEWPVDDMMSYMNSLSKFEKGNTATIVVDRSGKEMAVEVTF